MSTLSELIERGGSNKRSALKEAIAVPTNIVKKKEASADRLLARAETAQGILESKQRVKSANTGDLATAADLKLRQLGLRESIANDQQSRELLTSQDKRAQESFSLDTEVKKQQLTTMELENTGKAKQIADTVLSPIVEQAISFNNLYNSGDPNAKAARDNIIQGLLKDEKVKGQFKASVPFYEFSTTTLREYLEMTEPQKSALFVALQGRLSQYKTKQAQEASRAAEDTANAQFLLNKAAAKGNTMGGIEGRIESGQPAVPVEPPSDTELKSVRTREGDLWMDTVNRLKVKEDDLKELGLSVKDFENMDPVVFDKEKQLMDTIVTAAIQGDKNATIFGQKIDFSKPKKAATQVLNLANQSPLFDATSPYRKILDQLQDGGKLSWKNIVKESDIPARANEVLRGKAAQRSALPN